MSKPSWYWHRLRAMTPGEMALHARKKLRQFADARRERDWGKWGLEAKGPFPVLPAPEKAPAVLRETLPHEVEDILAGRWKAFGHLDLKVEDPPKWHCDYLVGRDLATSESAFKLNHRALPGGADIKLIWELSRWHQLVRLAMAAYVLGDARAARKCVDWLEDWVKHNPPYRGWNWTSALEVGMRLIEFTWIDALLGEPIPGSAPSDAPATPNWSSALQSRLEALRHAILPPHAWYAWRHKSFGSSANNHLLGELAGLVAATARWPLLRKWGAPLSQLQQPLWEREVLAQFAEDGGNKEQALNYQLFSWELCWHARTALHAAARPVHDRVEDRLMHAANFFSDVQVDSDPWDYGDSDSALVTPLFAESATAIREWMAWFDEPQRSEGLRYWWGEWQDYQEASFAFDLSKQTRDWLYLPHSGIAVYRQKTAIRLKSDWELRWDLSPLGYLRTAAHGHLDALHLSLWCQGVAMVIDPGTGAYYADARLRDWLASRAAHNGPCPAGVDFPRRLGPFLWSAHHEQPVFTACPDAMQGTVQLGSVQVGRRITAKEDGRSWQVQDFCRQSDGVPAPFTVRWQFAPGSWVKRISDRRIVVHRGEVAIGVEAASDWATVELVEPPNPEPGAPRRTAHDSMDGVVSPAFRAVCWAPCLKLTAAPKALSQNLHTTFSCRPA